MLQSQFHRELIFGRIRYGKKSETAVSTLILSKQFTGARRRRNRRSKASRLWSRCQPLIV